MRELMKVAGTATPNHLTIMYANFLLKSVALLGVLQLLFQNLNLMSFWTMNLTMVPSSFAT